MDYNGFLVRCHEIKYTVYIFIYVHSFNIHIYICGCVNVCVINKILPSRCLVMSETKFPACIRCLSFLQSDIYWVIIKLAQATLK